MASRCYIPQMPVAYGAARAAQFLGMLQRILPRRQGHFQAGDAVWRHRIQQGIQRESTLARRQAMTPRFADQRLAAYRRKAFPRRTIAHSLAGWRGAAR